MPSSIIAPSLGYSITIPVGNGLDKPEGYADFFSPEQPEKAELPIELTELGMVTEVSPEQFLKA